MPNNVCRKESISVTCYRVVESNEGTTNRCNNNTGGTKKNLMNQLSFSLKSATLNNIKLLILFNPQRITFTKNFGCEF